MTHFIHLASRPLLPAILLSVAQLASATPLDEEIPQISHSWAKANYELPAPEQARALEALIARTHKLASAHPDQAEPLIWEGIATAGLAERASGLTALNHAKHARDLLLDAEKRNSVALHGLGLAALGSLYCHAPGWPLGFGDRTTAFKYLDQAIQENPSSLDNNYFYADCLVEKGSSATAKPYIERAKAAPPRIGYEREDAGRKSDLAELTSELQKHAD